MKYSIKKPGTKNVFMILVSILLVGGAFVFAEYRNNQAKTLYIKPDVSAGVGGGLESNQSENDTDWKRVLLANDLSATGTVKDLTKKTAPLSPSDLLARDFFARYMELQQTGDVNDTASQEELIARVLQNGSIVATPKVYSYTDIKVKDDSSKEAVRNYGNEVGMAFKNNSIKSRNEAVIAKEALDKGDAKILSEIDPILASNRKVLESLLKIQAPQSLARAHLEIVNVMSSVVFMDTNFKKAIGDPYALVQAIDLYIKNNERISVVFTEIKNVMVSSSILYSSIEGGSIFLQS